MQDRNREDELAHRRAQRERHLRSELGPSPDDEGEEELPKFSWSDTFAMIIAAYQVLLPMLLAMVGVMVAAYLLFRWFFA